MDGSGDQRVLALRLLKQTVGIENFCPSAVIQHALLPVLKKLFGHPASKTEALPFMMDVVCVLFDWLSLHEISASDVCTVVLEMITTTTKAPSLDMKACEGLFSVVVTVLGYPHHLIQHIQDFTGALKEIVNRVDQCLLPAFVEVAVQKQAMSAEEQTALSRFFMLLCAVMNLHWVSGFERPLQLFGRKCVFLLEWAFKWRAQYRQVLSDGHVESLLAALVRLLKLCPVDEQQLWCDWRSELPLEPGNLAIIDAYSDTGAPTTLQSFHCRAKLVILYMQYRWKRFQSIRHSGCCWHRFDEHVLKFATSSRNELVESVCEYLEWICRWNMMSEMNSHSMSQIIYILSRHSSNAGTGGMCINIHRQQEAVLGWLECMLVYDDNRNEHAYTNDFIVESLDEHEQHIVVHWVYTSDCRGTAPSVYGPHSLCRY